MNYISNVLQKNCTNSVCSFIPFITAGYPSINLTLEALIELDKQGADAIELGIPYSDALADGPLIQEASKCAIENGVNIQSIFDILQKVNNKIKAPIIIFTYYNPILVKGLESFICEIADLGVKGLIIPDLPLEESDYVIYLCKCNKIELILFISPTSCYKRILDIIKKSPGCLYLVSSTGVTGIRENLNGNINKSIYEALMMTDKMIILGFGISTPDQVDNILKFNSRVNGIVVGSAFTKIFSTYINNSNINVVRDIGSFCHQMKSATCK
uniref:Tryptophan synthase alpha chain n=1 Tax=Kapraunia schneideri TaxID=717899 RepID=A0A1Z1MSK4_9FLOR|nr:Tryptophan synthase alpha subunit [Kapraunia schneideri]ARW68859.1 Tryptophan synthase alpha subunit [Kapraunia schneideri]